MKIGIIGGGRLAIENSLRLTTLGAEVSIFSPSLGGKVKLFENENLSVKSTEKDDGHLV